MLRVLLGYLPLYLEPARACKVKNCFSALNIRA